MTDPRLTAGRNAFALDRAVNAACDALDPRRWTLILRALSGEQAASEGSSHGLLTTVRCRAAMAPPQAVRWQQRVLINERRHLLEANR